MVETGEWWLKRKVRFTCQQCGQESLKWMGRCPGCGEWNTMVEEGSGPSAVSLPGALVPPVAVTEVQGGELRRSLTGIRELDRVLGGGVVPGSVVLVGGDPGIGKSTLLLQAANQVSMNGPVLYITGEESVEQVRLRAERLGTLSPRLYLMAETSVEAAILFIRDMCPLLVIIDSIQTMFLPELSAAPGSVGQVRECAARLVRVAKVDQIPVVLVGHVTKDGALAGPRVLEHMVDTVLYFEGDRHHAFRILRSVKNRFGATNEIGVFEMAAAGLQEVANPSQLFLQQRPRGAAGSVVVMSLEGTRPVLLEVQALVSGSGYANPRRLATGLDWNRALLMIAVLDRRGGFSLAQSDVFLNVAGGVRAEEPALDLGICLAIASSHRNRPLPVDMVVAGEVGLAGEVRAVTQLETRLKEAAKLGFRRAIVPQQQGLPDVDMELAAAGTLEEALAAAFGG